MQRNSTAVTTFELYIDEEVDNNNKLYKWYERSMGRMVYGTNGLHVVRIVRGTNSQWYEKSMVRIVNGTKSPVTVSATDPAMHGGPRK